MLTSYKRAMSEIESLEFSVYSNVASGIGVFKKAVMERPVYNVLLQAANSGTVQEKILARAVHLINDYTEKEFQHPHDVALAVYAMILSDKDLYSTLLDKLAGTSNLWWAKKVNESYQLGNFPKDMI